MNILDLLFGPFIEFAFMRRALAGAVILAISAGPVGVFLMLRRMSLSGDAMSHAILPGVAVGFLVAGLQILPMTIGGLFAGLVVALSAGFVSRITVQREETSLAALYLISLALGVLLISLRGSSVDLMHVLFGSVLALNNDALIMIGAVSTLTLFTMLAIWRPLFAECLDPSYLRNLTPVGQLAHMLFLAIVVLNLVGGFQALGTLLSVGLMILPAAAARFWVRRLESLCLVAILVGTLSTWLGLLISFHLDVPSGPAIILVAGTFYAASLIIGRRGVLVSRYHSTRHRTA